MKKFPTSNGATAPIDADEVLADRRRVRYYILPTARRNNPNQAAGIVLLDKESRCFFQYRGVA